MAKAKAPKRDLFTSLVEKSFGVECVAEFKFHPTRRWRFDYAIPSLKIAIEIDGGIFIYGRHNHATGYVNDMEKFNEASCLGWVVLKFQPKEKYQTKTLDYILRTIKQRENDFK